MTSPRKTALVVLLVALAALAGYLLACEWNLFEKKFDFTNPALRHVENKSLLIGERLALQKKIEERAETALREGRLSNYGIYYRELVSGPVIALREDEDFSPASLLKLPVAMWYFKSEERTPGLLSEEIVFVGPVGQTIAHFPPTRSLEAGKTYTVRELIERMLTESDNDATEILVEYAGGRERINEVYDELGIKDVENYDTYLIDVHTYAAFFRVIYNSEFLAEEHSDELLELLTKTSFREGLAAGLDEKLLIAHKFGERVLDEGAEQLHDCGIFYLPENPYLLCIMTQGKDYKEMAEFIAAVSQDAYYAASMVSENRK